MAPSTHGRPLRDGATGPVAAPDASTAYRILWLDGSGQPVVKED